MNTTENFQNETLNKLFASEPLLVMEALISIEQSIHIEYFPNMIKVLKETQSAEIKNKIIDILSDVKDKNLKQIILNSLMDVTNKSIFKELCTICWQSSIDFSENLELFAQILIEEPLEVAIEALTVIEERIHECSDNQKNTLITYLNDNKEHIDSYKQKILVDFLQ
ncbi:MAG: hypothetical protein IPO21_17680 [Bacteroidales bacterium]|nr:hypothetical protein [Bacteroidales bacterium]